MHELSLAQDLLRQLHELAAQNGAYRILTVTVEVGQLSGIVPDSFDFGFTALAAESPLTSSAKLKIKTPMTDYQCLSCGHLLAKCNKRPDNCPACTNGIMMPKGGMDLILLNVEMDIK